MYKNKKIKPLIETQPLKGKKHVSEDHFDKKKDKFCENDQAKIASKFLFLQFEEAHQKGA